MVTSYNDGRAYVFTYPYWIYVDLQSPPKIVEVSIENFQYRIYPPFSNSAMVSLNTPYFVDSKRVPFRPHRGPDYSTFKIQHAAVTIPIFDATKPSGFKNIILNFDHPDIHTFIENNNDTLPLDSIRLDVYSPIHSHESGEVGTAALQFKKQFMELLRWRSKQWWITRSSYGLSSVENFSFRVTTGGAVRPDTLQLGGEGRARTPDGKEKLIDADIWNIAINDIKAGTQVPLYELLLLEAHYFHATGDLRQAVPEADGACEQMKEITFEKLWLARNPGKIYDDERRNDLLRSWDLPRHLDVKFNNHFQRSYKTEHPDEWDTINNLYDARNNVAHGGQTHSATLPHLLTTP